MKTISYWEVYDDYSEDGRGKYIKTIGRFQFKDDAEKFAIGRGNYGKNAEVKHVVFSIASNINEVDEIEKDNRRILALKKLTQEERDLLGLKF